MLTVKAAMVAAGGVVEGCARFDVRARATRGAEDVDANKRCDWPARLSARNRPSSSSQSARISEQKISDIKIGSKRACIQPSCGDTQQRDAIFRLIRL